MLDSHFGFSKLKEFKSLTMKYTISLLIITALFFASCFTDSSSNNGTTTTDNPTGTITSTLDWICTPNEKVGPIQQKTSEEELIKLFGKESVIRKTVGAGEGVMVAASIVYPNTDNELIIEWEEGKEYQRVSRIRIEKENTQWKTDQGITVGTSLEELIKLNTKDFKFHGFEWDYSGITNNWEDGNINKQLVVFLEAENPEAIFPKLLGDEEFSTADPKAKEAKLKVGSMTIYFGL